jgi:hypothetical protein
MNAFGKVASSGLLVATLALVGCQSKPPAYQGFISDYSKLQKQEGDAMRYVSPNLANYNTFLIDPPQVSEGSKLSAKERAEVAKYFQDSFGKALKKHGYQVVQQQDEGVARIRVAVTDVQESKWYLNLHPASKLSGAGTGGASMEGEVVDSVTGEQLAAVVQVGKGNQFELDTFSKLDDIKDTIDKWAENAATRLDELKARTRVAAKG